MLHPTTTDHNGDSILTLNRSLLLGINKGIESLSLQPNEDASISRMRHFSVPFPRDPDFIERPAIQSWIKQQHAGPISRMALVGLGGFGYGLPFSRITI